MRFAVSGAGPGVVDHGKIKTVTSIENVVFKSNENGG